MKPQDLNIQIASPCDEPWDKMAGDANVRHCSRCDKSVFNLSAMTLAEVHELVQKTGNKFCKKYYLRADGTLMLDDCPVGLRAARTRVAKVAFTAVSLIGALLAVRQPHLRVDRALSKVEATRLGKLAAVRHAIYAYRMEIHGSIPDVRRNQSRFPSVDLEPYDGVSRSSTEIRSPSGYGGALEWPYVGIGTIRLKDTSSSHDRWPNRNWFTVSGA